MSAPKAVAQALALAIAAALVGCGDGPGHRAPSADFDPDSIPDAFARPTAALAWPGATRAFQVDPQGHLYNGAWTVRVAPSADGVDAPAPRRVAYEGRWLPRVRWDRRAGDVRWSFEAVAFPGPGRRDTGLVVSLLARAVNLGSAPHDARLVVELGPPPARPAFVAFDAPATPSPALHWATRAKRDTAYGWGEGEPRGDSWLADWNLAPGAAREARFLLPAYPAPSGELRAAARVPHAERVESLRRYWAQLLGEGARFELGDPEAEAALDAARVLLLTCRERRGERWFAIGGPFQYRDVWLRDGARAIHALTLLGHVEVARELAAGMLAFQWPTGGFLSQRGQPDGTGQALWTFEQALLRPMPDDSLARFADAAVAAWKWLEWQRDVSREARWRHAPMLPYADPRDGELVRAPLVGTDAWAIAGYRATARLLHAAGRDGDAAEVEQSLARYRREFAAALEATGSRDIPPSWPGEGRDWGNLAVGWPCGALAPEHPRLLALARRVWARAGGGGIVSYGSRDSLHGYVGADLGTWALLAGRRAEADTVLAALLRWRNASGALGEIFARDGGYGENLPPHPTAAAALVALTRNCLLYDDGDTLELTMGARERWWRSGARVREAPTRWGRMDLQFGRAGAQARWQWSRVPVWTALTLPPRTRLAREPEPPLVARSRTRVLAPPGTHSATLTIAAE